MFYMYVWRGRVEELASDCLEEKKLSATLQIDLEKQEKENETFKKVVDSFHVVIDMNPCYFRFSRVNSYWIIYQVNTEYAEKI